MAGVLQPLHSATDQVIDVVNQLVVYFLSRTWGLPLLADESHLPIGFECQKMTLRGEA